MLILSLPTKEVLMLSDKPWRKEFDRLLEVMKARWGGRIDKMHDPDHGGLSLTDLYVYPIYKTAVDNFNLHITISEFPLPGINVMAAADNVEFISILMTAPCTFNAAIRHESFMDRFKKKLGLEYEAQTGNEKFDKKYFLITPPKEDLGSLKSIQVQQRIMDLEPFDGVYLGKGGISFSNMITDAKELEIQNIERTIEKLKKLAGSIIR
jgi:hypothetical protein